MSIPAYFILILLLLLAAYAVFWILVRRDYKSHGHLTPFTSFLQLIVWTFYMAFPYLYSPVDWPSFWIYSHSLQQVVGCVLIVLGIVAAFGTMFWFGLRRAFGLQGDGLVQTGPYRLSRNPQIVGGFPMVAGVFSQWPSWYSAGWVLLYMAIGHMMVRSEEEHLRALYGETFEAYCHRVPRYLGSWRGIKSAVFRTITTTSCIVVSAFVYSLTTATCGAQSKELSLDKPMALFFEMKFEQALPLFRQIADQNQKNAETQTWLAETYRRLGRTDEALRAVRKALELSPCSSFAHLVLAQASYPDSDTIFAHVTAAIECDSTDPNAWLMMWGEAIRHADPALRNKCLRKLVEAGFFTKAALAYGRAELRTLPLNAILITNGDMDTYPAQAVQVTEGLRPDVAVIEREHLGISWSYRFIRDHQNVPLPVSDGQLDSMTDLRDNQGNIITKARLIFRQVLDQALRGVFQRPVALAPTLEEDFYSSDNKHFKYEGMFLLWQPTQDNGIADTTTIRQCLEGLDPDDFSGPWASMKDRSPVRRYYTKELVRVLSQVALTYSHELIKAHHFSEAERTLQWVEQFESRTELGPTSTKDIERLREALNKSTR